jgi:hypothetical protein
MCIELGGALLEKAAASDSWDLVLLEVDSGTMFMIKVW